MAGYGHIQVGDHVWLDTAHWVGAKKRFSSRLLQIKHIDKKGRLYFSGEKLWGQWRYGFHPQTGRCTNLPNSVLRLASPKEIAAEFKRVMDEQERIEAEHQASAAADRVRDAAPELLDALKAAHEGIDRLLARLVEVDHGFLPTKSGQPWEAMLKVNAAIAKAEGRQ